MKTNQHITQEELEILESYLMDRLKPEEKVDLESRLQVDVLLQEKLAEVKGLIGGMEEAVLREKMKGFQEGFSSNPNNGIRGNQRWIRVLAIAASVIILLGVMLWIHVFSETQGQKVFHAYFEQDPGVPTTMSSTDTYAFDRGMVDFKIGNYTSAITLWQPLINKDSPSDTLNYFMGMAHLGLGESSEAILFLERVESLEDSKFQRDAIWYLALAHIKHGDFSSAKRYLVDAEHHRKEELMEIIDAK
ncbi:tetratricopeptide repeat protein [Pleomorphovibrio marinus]|uniref:tetratricopeptide repeat protein n=1 Tax=Pleomorphovibrio marinus TaxID=2164132 RepID=UPI000E0CBD08|nr:hypothetical protein [Pleomorphovibrio marinus]